MIRMFFKKTILAALVAAVGLASLPVFGAAAQGTSDPLSQGQVTNERLEQIWRRQLAVYHRMGRTDQFIERVQKLIDRARADGKDVSAVQTALDAFEEAAREAKPIYESMNGIVHSHQGFDESGRVTDPEKARETVRQMHEKMREVRETLDGAGRALREAIRAFRAANPRP